MLDMDGVIVDFVKGACLHHNRSSPYLQEENLGNWDIDKMWGMTHDECFDLPSSFWESLEWTKAGKEIVRIAEELVGRHNVYILSNPSEHANAVIGKLAWIKREMPEYRKKWFFGTEKHAVGGHNRLLIDDSDKNVEKYRAKGFPAVLVPALWNKYKSEESEWLKSKHLFFHLR